MIWFLQPLVGTAVSLGVELSVDHEPGHSNVLADGLSRDYPDVVGLFDPAKRVHVNLYSLLRRGNAWHLYPQHARWPDHLRTGEFINEKPGG